MTAMSRAKDSSIIKEATQEPVHANDAASWTSHASWLTNADIATMFSQHQEFIDFDMGSVSSAATNSAMLPIHIDSVDVLQGFCDQVSQLPLPVDSKGVNSTIMNLISSGDTSQSMLPGSPHLNFGAGPITTQRASPSNTLWQRRFTNGGIRTSPTAGPCDRVSVGSSSLAEACLGKGTPLTLVVTMPYQPREGKGNDPTPSSQVSSDARLSDTNLVASTAQSVAPQWIQQSGVGVDYAAKSQSLPCMSPTSSFGLSFGTSSSSSSSSSFNSDIILKLREQHQHKQASEDVEALQSLKSKRLQQQSDNKALWNASDMSAASIAPSRIYTDATQRRQSDSESRERTSDSDDQRRRSAPRLEREPSESREEARYPCPHPSCHKDFSTSGHARRHSRIHTSERTFVCPHEGCYTTFNRRDNCVHHQRRVHRVSGNTGKRRSMDSD